MYFYLVCDKGFYKDGDNNCVQCPKDTYNEKYNSSYCISCPRNEITPSAQTVDRDWCRIRKFRISRE